MENHKSQFGPGAGGTGTKNPYSQSFGSQVNPGECWNPGEYWNPAFTTATATGQFPFLQDNVPLGNSLCYDLFEEAEGLVIEIPFPGLTTETLSVVQENHWLRVWGETGDITGSNKKSPQQRKVIVNQVPKGVFDQTIMLPCEVADTTASFSNGILTIRLKKAVGKNAQKVPVQFH